MMDPAIDLMVDIVVIDIALFEASVDRQTVVRVRHALMLRTIPVPPWLQFVGACGQVVGSRVQQGVMLVACTPLACKFTEMGFP